MGYTHYYYYKNPVIEMMQNKTKKEQLKILYRGNREKFLKEWEKLPKSEAFVTRMTKHIKAFASAGKDIKAVIGNMPSCSLNAGGSYSEYSIVIKNGFGEGEPEITPFKISFNGDSFHELEHETFAISIFEMDTYQTNSEMAEEGVFGFCKTARKPYDFLVCVSLMVLKHHLGSDFRISSDGDFEDWEPSIKFYESFFKRKAPKQLMTCLLKQTESI